MFKTIPEMILYYLTFPIDTDSKQTLGIGCDREGTSIIIIGHIPIYIHRPSSIVYG